MKAQRFDPHAPVVHSVLRRSAAQDKPFLVTFARDPDLTACEALLAAGRALSDSKSFPVVPPKENATPVR